MVQSQPVQDMHVLAHESSLETVSQAKVGLSPAGWVLYWKTNVESSACGVSETEWTFSKVHDANGVGALRDYS